MKFGGTSMGSAERIRIAARIASDQHATRPVVCVVSAMSKVTDLLLDSMRRAEGGDEADLRKDIDSLRERHLTAMRELLPESAQPAIRAGIEQLIADFERIARGMSMLGERPPRSVDEAVATGEKLSALLMAAYLETQGIPSRAVNAAEVVVTDAVFGSASPLMEQTAQKAQQVLQPLLDA